MRILDAEAGASTFKVNLRVWKEGPPGSGPLASSPGVGTGDTQTALATFREIKKVGEHHGSHIGKGHCYEVRCTVQESERWSLGSQRLANIVLFWRHVEASSLWEQWWEGAVLKTIQHSLLEGAEDDQCPAQGCCGPETPLSSGMGGAPWAPHWASGVLACRLQTFIRYMICKHLVPFWMVDLFPYSFWAQQLLFWRSPIHLFCPLLFMVLVTDLRNHGQIQSHEVFLSHFLLWGI